MEQKSGVKELEETGFKLHTKESAPVGAFRKTRDLVKMENMRSLVRKQVGAKV